MIVDSSVLIALILQEPGHQKVGRVLRVEDTLHMSTATWVALGVVADRRLSEVNQHRLDAMIDGLGIVLVPLSVGPGPACAAGAPALRSRFWVGSAIEHGRLFLLRSGHRTRRAIVVRRRWLHPHRCATGEPRRLSRRRCEAPLLVNHAGLRTPLMTAITRPTTARLR